MFFIFSVRLIGMPDIRTTFVTVRLNIIVLENSAVIRVCATGPLLVSSIMFFCFGCGFCCGLMDVCCVWAV